MTKDHYIESVSVCEDDIEFDDYIVMLESQNMINLVVPMPQHQVVVYTDKFCNTYFSKLSIMGKFSPAMKVINYKFEKLRDNTHYRVKCDELGIDGDYELIRLGNSKQFKTKEEFANFLLSSSKI